MPLVLGEPPYLGFTRVIFDLEPLYVGDMEISRYQFMIVRARFILITAVLLAATILGARSIQAQDIPTRYFPETGHFVFGEFLAAYESIPDPELIYGLPITEAFPWRNGPADQVQYFENAVFLYDAEAIPDLRIRRIEVGSVIEIPETRTPLPYLFSPAACRTFGLNRVPVCYAFLEFYEANGGVSRFGEPISEFEIQANRIVQYFQFARFEWHPELPSGGEVTLTPLGREYFEQMNEPAWRLRPAVGNNIPQIILELKVRAYPADAVTTRHSVQRLTFLVQDQNHFPVPGARIEYTVKFPSGEIYSPKGSLTSNEDGVAQDIFWIDEDQIGLVEIFVTATYNNHSDHALTSFRIWW